MFEEHRKYCKKYRIQGALIIIMIQSIVILAILRGLKNNYHKRTGTTSTKDGSIYEVLNTETKTSNKNNIKEYHSITDIEKQDNISGNNTDYKSIFGEIKTELSNIKEKNDNILYEIKDSIRIDSEKIYLYNLFKNSIKNGSLDKGLLGYILNEKTISSTSIIKDIKFLIPDLNIDEQNADMQLQETIKDIKENDKNGIITILKNIQEDYNTTINSTNNKSLETYFSFTDTQAFEYIRKQLVIDENNRYGDVIKIASKKFDIDEDLIRCVIFTEQLRGFTTYRGIFKSLVAGNKYLMIMSQFSYGLGGIKEKSAIEIENRYKINDEKKYNEIFEYSTDNNLYNQRIGRLTSVNDYYYQIMYIAGALAMYRDQRLEQGYDISDKIGILTTLYNIGYKQPNDKPEIGGANIRINGNSWSFGRLSMAIFYIIKSHKYNN